MAIFIKKALRQRLLLKREGLSPSDVQRDSLQIQLHIKHWALFQKARRIALYLPLQKEVSLLALLAACIRQHKSTCVPVLDPNHPHKLLFCQLNEQSVYIKNRFGILEPKQPHRFLHPQELDLVCVPLVGFDNLGNRLGMGKGFYDTTFAFKKQRPKPFLLGVAFDFQRCDAIPHTERDIQLDGVVTPTTLTTFSKSPFFTKGPH